MFQNVSDLYGDLTLTAMAFKPRSETRDERLENFAMEESIIRKFKLLRKFTRDFKGSKTSAANHISLLPQDQFLDVVKDLCDEIFRRHENKDPFLLVRPEFQAKRNQARQKMATLGEDKIKEFAFDLLFELEKRFPFLLEYLRKNSRKDSTEKRRNSPPIDHQTPSPQPNKGEELTHMIDDFKNSMLEKQVREKKSLESRFKKLEIDYDQLSSQYQANQRIVQDLEITVQSLEQKLEKRDLQVKDVQAQNQQLVRENQGLLDRIAELEKQNQVLQDQHKSGTVRLGKGKLSRLSKLSEAPTRTSRMPSIRPSLRLSQAPTRVSRMSRIESRLMDPQTSTEFGDWIVEEMLFLADQMDECKTSNQPQSILEPLRDLITLSRMIAEECDYKEMDLKISEADKDLLFDMNYQISAALKLLVESSRNFVSTGKDNTSRHLDELIRLVQEFFKVYNTMGLKPAELPPMDFQQVLQEEVDEIALSIQDLLQVLKESEPDLDMVTDLVNHLVKHVDFAIIECSNSTPTNEKTEIVLEELGRARDALLDQYDDFMERPTSVKPIANAAYDIAKNSQDLLYVLDPNM